MTVNKSNGHLINATLLSDEGTPLWGFTGTMVGVFATRPDGSVPFVADFDFFRHELP